MGTLANSEDPDERPHNMTFHKGLHCLLSFKRPSEKEIKLYLESMTCNPSI